MRFSMKLLQACDLSDGSLAIALDLNCAAGADATLLQLCQSTATLRVTERLTPCSRSAVMSMFT